MKSITFYTSIIIVIIFLSSELGGLLVYIEFTNNIYYGKINLINFTFTKERKEKCK